MVNEKLFQFIGIIGLVLGEVAHANAASSGVLSLSHLYPKPVIIYEQLARDNGMHHHREVYGIPCYDESTDLPDCLIPNHLWSGVIDSLDELKRRARLAEKHLGADAVITQDAWIRVEMVETGEATLEEVAFTYTPVRWKKYEQVYRATEGRIKKGLQEDDLGTPVLDLEAIFGAEFDPAEFDPVEPEPLVSESVPDHLTIYQMRRENQLLGVAINLDEYKRSGVPVKTFDLAYDFACEQLGASSCRAEKDGKWLRFTARAK